jgi:hypothetical protein
MQPFFEFADDVGKVRDRSLFQVEHVHALDARIELALDVSCRRLRDTAFQFGMNTRWHPTRLA